jgi:hypothetical protein
MTTQQALLDSFLEITLNDPNDFLIVKETLTRIGIASRKNNTLYQSAHILHKQGRYYILSFLEFFKLDGKPSNFTEEDRARVNTIAALLEEWNLLKVVNPEKFSEKVPMSKIKVISHEEKNDYNLVSKYSVGNKWYCGKK